VLVYYNVMSVVQQQYYCRDVSIKCVLSITKFIKLR